MDFYIPLLISLMNFLLALIILFKNAKDRINVFFAITVLGVAFWSFGISIFRIVGLGHAYFWGQFVYLAVDFTIAFFLYFSFVFPYGSIPNSKILRAISVILPLVVFILAFIPRSIISDIAIDGQNKKLGFGWGYYIHSFVLFTFFIWAFVNLLKKYISSKKERNRKQLFYLFLGTGISFLIGVTTNVILPFFNIANFNWIGPSATIIMVIFVAYSIIKYNLMNIKIIATEFFAGLLVLTYLTSVIQSENLTIFLVRIFLFMVSVVVALLLIRSAYGEVKRREEMEQLTKKLQKTTSDLKFANKELMRLDDVKSEFLSIASHQLRTPSTAVKGYTSMILEGSFGKISKPVKESMEKVFLANERLLNLVESLLNISRIEAGREDLDIKPVDMAAIVKPIIEDFGIKAKEKKLKLSMEVEPRLPKAAGDASKIKEVVSNIIDNSLKYTNEGEIMINLHQESQSIVFACQDTGIGIEPDDLPRLFNKFVRGKDMMQVHTEGTGLGIYYARLLVESMGGRIWAESPGKNKGAKFSFSLPMADKSKARRVKSG